jgi:hypothetical protein
MKHIDYGATAAVYVSALMQHINRSRVAPKRSKAKLIPRQIAGLRAWVRRKG